jgi:hypothetical protein
MHIGKPLSAACVAAAALTASASADAHYYATVHSVENIYGPADNGAAIILRTNSLHQTCNTFVQDFVTHEMWYMTDDSGNYWIEVGFWDGEGTNAIFNPCNNDMPFWADSRPGGGLNVHWTNNGWSFGDYYQGVITAAGDCTWNVILGGVTLGTSTSNCPGSGRFFRAGIETTTQGSGSVQGFATGWQAQDGWGNWSAMGQATAGQGWGALWMNWDGPPNMQQVGDSSWGIQTEETLNEPF